MRRERSTSTKKNNRRTAESGQRTEAGTSLLRVPNEEKRAGIIIKEPHQRAMAEERTDQRKELRGEEEEGGEKKKKRKLLPIQYSWIKSQLSFTLIFFIMCKSRSSSDNFHRKQAIKVNQAKLTPCRTLLSGGTSINRTSINQLADWLNKSGNNLHVTRGASQHLLRFIMFPSAVLFYFQEK